MTTVIKRTRNSAIAEKPRDVEVSQGQVTKHGTIQYVRYGFLVCYSNFVPKWRRFSDIQLQKMS